MDTKINGYGRFGVNPSFGYVSEDVGRYLKRYNFWRCRMEFTPVWKPDLSSWFSGANLSVGKVPKHKGKSLILEYNGKTYYLTSRRRIKEHKKGEPYYKFQGLVRNFLSDIVAGRKIVDGIKPTYGGSLTTDMRFEKPVQRSGWYAGTTKYAGGGGTSF